MSVACPACGAKRCPTEAWHERSDIRYVAVGPCGWCDWQRVGRKRPEPVKTPPRTREMGDEEFGFRSNLFDTWKTKPASELRQHLEVFADWLADRGDAEESAARADWKPRASKRHDPAGWHLWTVPVALSWPEAVAGGPLASCVNGHNGRWFLAWPPGYVRFTGPTQPDGLWLVTVMGARNLDFSTAVDGNGLGGWVRMFTHRDTPLEVRGGRLGERRWDTGLFAEEA